MTQGHDLPKTAALRTELADQCPVQDTLHEKLVAESLKLKALRGKLVAVAASQVGVKEKTGKNDGPEVAMYLREVGLPEGYAYCAAGLTWCHNQLGIPNPKSAWSPDWFKANVVYRRGKPLLLPFESLPGQVAGFYSESKKRVSHVALIESESRQHYFTIEFNTNGAGSDDGEGVRRLMRKKGTVHVIADHVGNYIKKGGHP
ncbi:hypothetical protein BA6E_105115 [Bacteroidales bacterium 6E]|nr:hypothetical protein BA6E_105115 [Bacteroidales bacterium 6E]